MKRRNFLASLFAAPVAAALPVPTKVTTVASQASALGEYIGMRTVGGLEFVESFGCRGDNNPLFSGEVPNFAGAWPTTL